MAARAPRFICWTLFHDALIRQHPELAPEGVGGRRHELGEEHHEHVLGRIAPERRRGGTAPRVFPGRAEDLRLGGIDQDREAEPEAEDGRPPRDLGERACGAELGEQERAREDAENRAARTIA